MMTSNLLDGLEEMAHFDGWLVGWEDGSTFGWLVGWEDGRSVGLTRGLIRWHICLVGSWVEKMAHLLRWLLGWEDGSAVGWLVGWDDVSSFGLTRGLRRLFICWFARGLRCLLILWVCSLLRRFLLCWLAPVLRWWFICLLARVEKMANLLVGMWLELMNAPTQSSPSPPPQPYYRISMPPIYHRISIIISSLNSFLQFTLSPLPQESHHPMTSMTYISLLLPPSLSRHSAYNPPLS